jgi:hypothetical protein
VPPLKVIASSPNAKFVPIDQGRFTGPSSETGHYLMTGWSQASTWETPQGHILLPPSTSLW